MWVLAEGRFKDAFLGISAGSWTRSKAAGTPTSAAHTSCNMAGGSLTHCSPISQQVGFQCETPSAHSHNKMSWGAQCCALGPIRVLDRGLPGPGSCLRFSQLRQHILMLPAVGTPGQVQLWTHVLTPLCLPHPQQGQHHHQLTGPTSEPRETAHWTLVVPRALVWVPGWGLPVTRILWPKVWETLLTSSALPDPPAHLLGAQSKPRQPGMAVPIDEMRKAQLPHSPTLRVLLASG